LAKLKFELWFLGAVGKHMLPTELYCLQPGFYSAKKWFKNKLFIVSNIIKLENNV
jgi:hypothetical protein